MSYRESDIAHEGANGKDWVLKDHKHKAYTVLLNGAVCSTPDSSYPMTPDGLSVAKARADYLDGKE